MLLIKTEGPEKLLLDKEGGKIMFYLTFTNTSKLDLSIYISF